MKERKNNKIITILITVSVVFIFIVIPSLVNAQNAAKEDARTLEEQAKKLEEKSSCYEIVWWESDTDDDQLYYTKLIDGYCVDGSNKELGNCYDVDEYGICYDKNGKIKKRATLMQVYDSTRYDNNGNLLPEE